MATWLNETSFPSGNGSHFRLRLYYDLSQNIPGNYSDVTFYLYFASVDGYSGSGASSNGYVNNNWVGSTTYVGRNAEVYLGSRTDRYYHNNDGTGSAGYSASISSPWGLGTASLSGTLGLPTIPRQAIVTSATNFTDEENPTITFTNPAGFIMDAKLEFGGIEIIKSNIPNTGSYTFQLTDAERTLLRQKCTAKTMTVRETIATYIASSTPNYWSWLDKTMTMVNATPTKSSFDVIDTNTTTTAITGDNTKFIKSASNAKVNFNFSTLKYATLSVMKINGVTIENITPESSSEGTTNYEVEYTINGINTSNIDIYIKDSRGIEYTDTKALDMIDYIPVSANVSAKRKQPTTGEIETKFNGNYFNSTLGNTSNTLTIKYKYKKVEEQSYSNYITLVENTDYTIDNNTFYSGTYSSEYPITLSPSFDYRYDYEIVIEFSDILTSATKTITVVKGIPIIQWNKTKFQVNGDLYIANTDGTNPQNIHSLVPTGIVNSYAGSVAPTGWLICDGSEVSRTTYANLFNVIGTTYGNGDGSTTFNLPNLKGRIPVGYDSSDSDFDTLGETGGEKTHQLTISEMPSHSHATRWNTGYTGETTSAILWQGGTNQWQFVYTESNGGDQPHNILQPYIVLNYIIKY